MQARMSGVRIMLVGLALFVTAGAGIAALLGGFGYRWGWWSLGWGFSIIRGAAYAAIVGGCAGLIAGVLPPWRSAWQTRLVALSIAVTAFGIVVPPWLALRTAQGAPAINDITTDTEDPPAFVAIVPLRAASNASSNYPGADFAERQHRFYPDIAPARLNARPPQAFARARAVTAEMGLDIVAAQADAGRLEAVAETRWFGFKDDVVIRVRADGNGSRVDIRSKSRIGRGDRGMNAWRVRNFLKRLRG